MFFSFSHNHIGLMIHARKNPGFNKGNAGYFFKMNFISSETGIQSCTANRDRSKARMPQGTQETI
jgi:hypothetical protein